MDSQWKSSFSKGIVSFQTNQLEDALVHFSEAINLGANDAITYDSRAAVYEKLQRTKEALLDAKMVIKLAPDRWQGYARSARLFLNLNKFDHARTMVQMALDRIKLTDTKRRAELDLLKERITTTQDSVSEQKRRNASEMFCHFGKLPLEIAVEIFTLALQDDHARVVILTQVCKDWRATIHHIPSLWNTLVLSSRNPRKKVKLWKPRCKGRLEKLCVRGHFDDLSLALDDLRDAPLNRLRILALHQASVTVFRQKLPSFTPAVLCNLEELEIQEVLGTRDMHWLWLHPNMSLRCLRVQLVPIDWFKAAEHLSMLEDLSFQGPYNQMDQPDLLQLIHANQRLEKLELILLDAPTSHFHQPPEVARDLLDRIHLPHLTHLTIGGDAGRPSWLFPILSLPSLRSLRFIRCREQLDAVIEHLVSSGAAAGLQELIVESSFVSSGPVIKALRMAPDLRRLQLSHVGGNQVNAVAEALATPFGRSSMKESGETTVDVLCPKLTHVDFSHSPDIQSGPIIRLVKGRLPASATPPMLDESANDTTPSSTCSASSDQVFQIASLILDGCPLVDASLLPWLRSKVSIVQCTYLTKKEARRKR